MQQKFHSALPLAIGLLFAALGIVLLNFLPRQLAILIDIAIRKAFQELLQALFQVRWSWRFRGLLRRKRAHEKG